MKRISLFKVQIFTAFSLFVLANCSYDTDKAPNNVYKLNPTNATEIVLSELTTDVRIIQLDMPDSIYFGEIESFKSTGDHMIFHDLFQTKSLTFFNEKGKFEAQLRKEGRGPEDYTSLDTYAFNSKRDLLYIHQRSLFIRAYSFPEFKVLKEYKTDEGLMNIETINDELLLVPERSNSQEKTEGIRLYNPETSKNKRLDIPTYAASMETSYPNTFYSYGSDSIIYANPDEITNIYQISKNELKHIGGIDFGKFSIPHKFWKLDDFNDFSMAFKEGPKAVWVQNIIVSNNLWTFYFVVYNKLGDHDNKHMVVLDPQTTESNIYSKITVTKKGPALPNPIGIHEGYYVVLIYPEFISDYLPNQPDDAAPQWQQQLFQQVDSETPTLLLFRIK